MLAENNSNIALKKSALGNKKRPAEKEKSPTFFSTDLFIQVL